MSSGSYQQKMDGSNLTQQQHGLDGHHHGSYSQQALLSLQQEQGSQEALQQDMLTQQLHQLLVADTTRFWTATVAPSAQSIHQCTMVLQKEANDLSSRAEAEMQNVMDELTRVHSLVASFQDQIRETLSLLSGGQR